jgi:hypothetical protein
MVIYYLIAAFRIWLLIDARRRRVDSYWYPIILFLPLGDWAYFFTYKGAELRNKLGQFRFYRRNSLEALSYAAQMTPSASNRLRLGEGLYDSGLRVEAREQFESVLQSHPTDARALYGLAMTLKADGKLQAAVRQFEQLIECSPAYNDYSPVLELADTQRELRQFDMALSTLEDLVVRSPRVKHSLAVAELLVEMGRINEAKSRLDSILREFQFDSDFVKNANERFFNAAKSLRRSLESR